MFNIHRGPVAFVGCCAVGWVTAGTAVPLFAADARQPRPAAAETITANISLSDLDLQTPEGVREARIRLTKAAKRLCRKWADERKVDDWVSYSGCTQESLAKALQRLSSLSRNVRN